MAEGTDLAAFRMSSVQSQLSYRLLLLRVSTGFVSRKILKRYLQIGHSHLTIYYHIFTALHVTITSSLETSLRNMKIIQL